MSASKERIGARIRALQTRMSEADLDWFVITNRDSIYYFTGAENYIERVFGRPTILLVPREGGSRIFAPFGDCPMIEAMSTVGKIIPFRDTHEGSWSRLLLDELAHRRGGRIGIEAAYDPLVVSVLVSEFGRAALIEACDMIDDLRLIKDASEIDTLRKGGIVAQAMMRACREALLEGVPEYEVSLAAINAGTRAAAAFLTDQGPGRLASPMIQGLQVFKTGDTTVLGHCRPTVRRIKAGEPVAVCLCGMISFGNMKLGMDRPFIIGHMTSEQERVCETALASQKHALEAVKPGARAEDIHRAATQVVLDAGYGISSRTGRGLGHSHFEKPQLIDEDKTLLRPGMVIVVDGNVKVPGCGVQFGDSVVVTDSGFEPLTSFSTEVLVPL